MNDSKIAADAVPAPDRPFEMGVAPEVRAAERDLLERIFLGPPSLGLRAKFFFTGVLSPLVCLLFVLTVSGGTPVFDQPWQSGKLEHYVAMLLDVRCQLLFTPLVFYSALSLAAWIFAPRCAAFSAIRFGIYSGAPLAGSYLVFFCLTSGPTSAIAAAIVAPLLALAVFLTEWTLRRVRRFTILHLMILTAIIGVLLGLLRLTNGWEAVGMTLLVLASATPTLNFVTYCRAAFMIVCDFPSPRAPAGKPFWWPLINSVLLALAWLTTWRLAIDAMLAEYAKLPTTDPNCYLSAAAAHRHAWLFREAHRGVSLQTKRLKFLEIALRCAAPRFHAALRRNYDHFGPPLARFCQKSRWFADVTYVILLPLEAAAAILGRVLRKTRMQIEGMYSNQATISWSAQLVEDRDEPMAQAK